MKSKFVIVKSNTWHPSTFYDTTTALTWVMSYPLFKKIYSGKISQAGETKFAIHKDVYDAFYLKYKGQNIKKTRKFKR